MTTTERMVPVEAEPYLAAVRSLLWALPAEERDELLDDLGAHLAELAAEEGPPLRERLGIPSVYAAEFVASAGVATPSARPSISMPRLRVPASVRRWWSAVQPAWVGLRPFLIVFGTAAILNGHLFHDIGPVELVGLAVVAVAAIGLSQRLTGTFDRIATAAAVIGALVLVGALSEGRQYIYVDSGGYGPPSFLSRADGTPISNIWAYDRDGNPIDVFLFDQDGQPIVDLTAEGWDPRTGENTRTDMRTDADGNPVPNLFPRDQRRVTYDEYGRPTEREARPPRMATPNLDRTITTTTTPSSTTTTTSTTAVQPAP